MNGKERSVKDESYYAVFGWMTNPKKMNLSGLELQLFAIIYGFCQAQPLNGYFASTNYLAEFTGATDRGVRKALDSLIKKGYIIKEAQEKYHTYKYIAIVPDFDETEKHQNKAENYAEQNAESYGNNVPDEELSSGHEELSSGHEELSSGHEELSSEDAEHSSTNNIYINNNNNISKEPTKKDGASLCEFSDSPDVKLTISELRYLIKYYGPEDTMKYITKLQKYIEKTGKEYKSHLDTIEKWILEDRALMTGEGNEGMRSNN